jgi:twitching motility protein PilT
MSEVLSKFHKVLRRGVEIGASDVHLCVGAPWRFRVNGQMTCITSLPRLTMDDAATIIGHMVEQSKPISQEEMQVMVKRLQELDCSYSVPGMCRYRVNVCRQRGSFAMVLRMIPLQPPSISDLGLPEVIRTIAHEERGLVLVTGITGSGKSTTLAAMINEINQEKACKVVTIEDPIEYLHPENRASIIQREVGMDTDSFAVALRNSLRQDPDIILVGEMRDRVTVDTALKAGETGHLVLSTLHTGDAPRTIQRVISFFELSEEKVVRLRLAENLRAVISQRLVERKDGTGRIAVTEIMRHTLTIQDCIENPEKSAAIKDYIASGRKQYGMQTFDQHLMELYEDDVIELETAIAAATSPSDFERAVQFT